MKLIRDIKKNPFSYLLAFPAMAYTFVFGYLTMPYIIIAFERYNVKQGIWGSDFVGIQNFMFFFGSNRAAQVTFNTVYINFMSLVLGTALAVLVALLMNEVRTRTFLRITQSVLIFPNFLSWVIVSYIVFAIFSSERGLINTILQSLGLDTVSWYSSPQYWRGIMIAIKVWKTTGINSVIYLAAITSIDEGLYEAARIDGASRWQQTWRITIPLLMPTVTILALLSIGRIFYGDFQMMYTIVRDNGLLLPVTEVIDTYVYRALRTTGDPSAAMAVGLYQAAVGFVLVFGSNYLIRRKYPEGALL